MPMVQIKVLERSPRTAQNLPGHSDSQASGNASQRPPQGQQMALASGGEGIEVYALGGIAFA